ncbi:Transposable element tcb2 transposase [Caligus rogercresseyi]|uniref:Transposable element tcb2 transposase n=1 Tax=Caligus rogercresseyi TaxID=217165 RepID=A0A7T8HFE4_CALRO|nr:Transposable element tcb2 transposase [Caligus rogercresseyi]
MDSVASGTPYTFQQDSAPAHKVKLVHFWLKKNIPNFWDFNTWPPNRPDLNPCDYYL